jgi:hypothetical protein
MTTAPVGLVIGAPEEIRTPDPQIRSLVLYPAELRALTRLACSLVHDLFGKPASTFPDHALDKPPAASAACDARHSYRLAPKLASGLPVPRGRVRL